MGKIIKAMTTGISSRRRRELKVNTLMVSGDYFNTCFELTRLVGCNDEWYSDVDETFHTLGRVVESTAEQLTFGKTRVETRYIKSRVTKYLIPVLEVLFTELSRLFFTMCMWDDELEKRVERYNQEEKMDNLKEQSINRLLLIV
jgi:hypothetical protein